MIASDFRPAWSTDQLHFIPGPEQFMVAPDQRSISLLLLTYRYVGVMAQEVAVMTNAYHLRAPGQKGIHISAWGSFLGQLLLRSMDRAQELYASMLLRGYHEHFHYAPVKPFRGRDALYLLGCVLVFVLLRTVRVAQLLGASIVR